MIELIEVDKKIDEILEIVEYKKIYKLIKDDKIIGYGTINYDKENILFIFVQEEFRGNGYGKILFSMMVKEAQIEGYKEIKVIFKRDNIQMLKIVNDVGGLHLSSKDDFVKYLIPLQEQI